MSESNDRSSDDPARVGPFRIVELDGPERGVRVGCETHDRWEEYEPGYRSVAFYCPDCAIEVAVRLHDDLEWRDLGEMC